MRAMPADPRRLVLDDARRVLLDAARCPSCGTTLDVPLCATCGLDTGRYGAWIWAASLEAVAALDRRQAVVRGAMPAAAPAARPPGVGARPAAVDPLRGGAYAPPRATRRPATAGAAGGAARAPWTARPGTAASTSVPLTPGRPPEAPSGTSVQTVLQVLGASLLATASIVFLVFSWGLMSLGARAAVVALGTAVVLGLAAWLRRRGLAQSAEAVGALGAVLVGLDAWAVHATGLAGRTDGAVYAAAASAVCAVLLGAYGRLTGVRAGIVAAAVLAPGVPVVLLPAVDGTAATTLLLLVATVVASARFVPGPPLVAERCTLAVVAALTLAAAVVTAATGLWSGGWDDVAAAAAVAAVAAGQAWGARGATVSTADRGMSPHHGSEGGRPPRRRDPVLDAWVGVVERGVGPSALTAVAVWSGTAGAVAALAGAAAARECGVRAVLGAAVVVAASCLVLLRRDVGRRPAVVATDQTSAGVVPGPVAGLGTATRAALCVAVALGLPSAVALLPAAAAAVLRPGFGGDVAAGDALAHVGAVLVVAALLPLSARARVVARTRVAHAVACWLATAALFVAVAVLGGVLAPDPVIGTVVALGVLGAGAAAVSVTGPARLEPVRLAVRATSLTAGVAALAATDGRALPAAAVLAVLAAVVVVARHGWVDTSGAPASVGPAGTGGERRGTAEPGSAEATGVSGAAQAGPGPVRALPTVAALDALTLVLGGLALGSLLEGTGASRGVAWPASAAVVTVVSAVVAVVGRTGRPSRHAALAVGVLAGLVGWALGVAWSAAPGGATAAVVLPGVVAGAALLVGLRGPGRVAPVAATAASALVPASVAGGVVTSWALLGWPPALATVHAVVGVGVAAVLLSPLPSGVRATPQGRPGAVAVEAVGWVVVALGVVAATDHGPGIVSLTLVTAAACAGASALRPDRRPQRWVALGLLVLASWTSLDAEDVTAPEPYLAPLGVVLVVVALRRWRRGVRSADLLAAGALLLGLPSAVAGGTLPVGGVEVPRAGLVAVYAALLLGAGLLALRGGRTSRDTENGAAPALVLLGTAGVLAVAGPFAYALGLAAASRTDPSLDGSGASGQVGVLTVACWAAVAAGLVAGAYRAALPALPEGRRAGADVAGTWLLLGVATLPLLLTQDATPAGALRVAVLAGVAVALGLRGAGLGGGPAPVPLAQGVTLALATTWCAMAHPWPVPADAWLVALGAALLAFGTVRLEVVPSVRTWPALGPGLVGALLVPCLTSLGAPEPWRTALALVGGVGAVAVGASRRWQAPFVLGGAVLGVQVLRQLFPVAGQMLAAAGWWPVLAFGGVCLLGLGLTYEQRLQDAREAAVFVQQMR